MKNLRFYLVLILVFTGIVMFSSCSDKNDFITVNNVNDSKEMLLTKTLVGDIEAYLNPVDYDMHLKAYSGVDDLKIRKNLLELSIVSRNLFIDNTYYSIIKEKAQLNVNSTFNLYELDSYLKSSNEEIDNLKSILNNIDLTRKVISNRKSANTITENYIPAIFVPNSNTADFNQKPFISPGLDVNCEIEGLESFEDYIIAWYYDDDNNLHEFMIDEDMAMKTKHPIFIIDNADEKLTNMSINDNVIFEEQPSNFKSVNSTNYYFSSYEYQLNYRFESSGKSDFWIVGLWTVADGRDHVTLLWGNCF